MTFHRLRKIISLPFPVFIILLLAPLYGASGASSAPHNLRCEYLTNPVAIDVTQPRFSWVLAYQGRGESQTAYEILVASSLAHLNQGNGDQWNSGKVASGDFSQIVYGGKPLEGGHTYYWEVRSWNAAGVASAYSRPASFGMGLLSRGEWKGQWIGGGNELRKEIQLNGRVVRARVYVTALGYYELHINGRKIGTKVLDPAYTLYPKRVLYSTYDVTTDLKPGANAIGSMLGGGWATLSLPHGFNGYYPSPALLLQLEVDLAGGKHVTLASDGTWKATQGPILRDSVYNGEVFDARREMPGWDIPGFDDSHWTSAQVVAGSSGALSAEMMPPIKVVGEKLAQSFSNPQPGVYVYDMGQNLSGWAKLRVQGPAGTHVLMRYSELIYKDGMINRANIRGAKSRDIYILRGGGMESYQPRFTYHGFRYVELTGFPGAPNLGTLRAEVVHSAVDAVGGFAASKPILNQIQSLIYWSQLTNLFSIPTDCDQRDERQGWMGDAQVTADEAVLNFDMAAFYTNFIRDIHDEQHPDGTITDTVPHRYGSRPADPAWGTAYPQLCWTMWKYYGDRRILEENYDGVKKYVEFLRSRSPGNILDFSYYGDWVPIVHTPNLFVSNAYYFYDVQILSKIAAALGRTADAQTYSQLATQIKDAINAKFFDASTGNYAGGTQTANSMALGLGLATQRTRGRVAGNLTQDIVYYHNTHITTGFIGIKFLMPVLTGIGHPDLAYELATQTTYPSWGYMIKSGATTLWELWQQKSGPSMNSQDHAMFGSVGAWFYQALAGINTGVGSVAYQHILIEPRVVEDLHWASASVETLRGRIASSWIHTPGKITLDVTIPAGSDAQIVIPKEEEMTQVTLREGDRAVWGNGQYVAGDPGVTGASQDARSGAITVSVGSGDYKFVLTGQ
ncbi:MAG TPA: family 78 glycoside hydrolase catalytic domain [Terriglobia bacterium]|nr:family 78 glycoside hydrolase catalytic domain [Terriglobia bacterium]